MLAGWPGRYGHACSLRASAPDAKPLVPSLTRRKLKALTAGLFRCAVQQISLCRGRSQQSRKHHRRSRGNRELMHGRLPQFVKQPPWIALILHKNVIYKKININ